MSVRPFIRFDLEIDDYPVLVLPSQSASAPPQLTIRYEGVGNQNIWEEHLCPSHTPIDGRYLSDPLELPVGPAQSGWGIDLLLSDDQPPISRAVYYQFPITHYYHEIPLFLFNARTSRLFNARGKETFPEELIILYPKQARLHVNGGQVFVEPHELHQEWNGWQYMVCALESEGTFNYHGPKSDFASTMDAHLDFKRSAEQNVPTLLGDYAPAWMRCLESWPIFMAPKPIEIHCNKESSSTSCLASIKSAVSKPSVVGSRTGAVALGTGE